MPGKTRREWAVLIARIGVRLVMAGTLVTAGGVGTHLVEKARLEVRAAESWAMCEEELRRAAQSCVDALAGIKIPKHVCELTCAEQAACNPTPCVMSGILSERGPFGPYVIKPPGEQKEN